MPYDSVNQLPKYVKDYSDKVKRQWKHVFNSVYERVLKETGSKKQAEERAFKAANAVLSRRMEKHGSYSINTHRDWFLYCKDKFLNNI